MATQLEHLCCFYNFLFLNRCVDYITKGSPWDLKNNIIMYNEKPEYPERTTDHGQATGKLYHLWLRVECTLFCNLQSRVQIHAV
jgi:hypothetical protein